MSLRISEVKEKSLWEDFLLHYRSTALFQSWLWGDVQRDLGVRVWRFGLYEESTLVGIFQIHKTVARRGSFLHIRHGPIFTIETREYWTVVMEYVKKLARIERVWFVRVSPQIENSEDHRMMLSSFGMKPSAIHAMDGEYCWILDLTVSEDELMKSMRKTTRYEIKKAQALGVTVEKSNDPHDLVHFQKLYDQTSSRHGFVQHKGIIQEYRAFVKEDNALLLLGSYEGQICAAALILFYGGQAIYHHGASCITKAPVSYLVQWEAIKEAKNRGMNVYNFWGIAPENSLNHPWRGHSLFKKGFGGRTISFLHAHDAPISPFYGISCGVETVRKWTKGY